MPIFDSLVTIIIIATGVEIADAFFKIVIDEVNGDPHAQAFVIPHGSRFTVHGSRKDSKNRLDLYAIHHCSP